MKRKSRARIEARQAENVAVQEELAIQQTRNAARVEKAKEQFLRAQERTIRLKAEIAFLAAGGARGDFARGWLSVFKEEMRGACTSSAASGN